jgi:ArsR family transcriptional regulator
MEAQLSRRERQIMDIIFSHGEATAVATDFEHLAHPVRLQLLDVLARNEGRVCVCDLEAAVPVKQPTVSHHLRLLREAGLIESEKVGQWVYYRIRRPARALRSRAAGTSRLRLTKPLAASRGEAHGELRVDSSSNPGLPVRRSRLGVFWCSESRDTAGWITRADRLLPIGAG